MCQDEEKQIIVRSSDTDLFIILLLHASTFSAHVWLDVGLSTNNTRRYVDITNFAQAMGSVLCSSVAALHAFTGCDFTSSFMRKGKLRPH